MDGRKAQKFGRAARELYETMLRTEAGIASAVGRDKEGKATFVIAIAEGANAVRLDHFLKELHDEA